MKVLALSLTIVLACGCSSKLPPTDTLSHYQISAQQLLSQRDISRDIRRSRAEAEAKELEAWQRLLPIYESAKSCKSIRNQVAAMRCWERSRLSEKLDELIEQYPGTVAAWAAMRLQYESSNAYLLSD